MKPAILIVAALILAAAPAPAQSPAPYRPDPASSDESAFPWRTVTTPGYAAIGMIAATPAAFGASSIGSGMSIFAAGFAGGAVAGWLIGDSAERRLARGETLSGGQKNAIRAGTVMAGAALGALAASLVINSGDGDYQEESPGSDETTFAAGLTAGAGLGVLTQVLLESRLEPRSSTRGRVAIRPGARHALVWTMEF